MSHSVAKARRRAAALFVAALLVTGMTVAFLPASASADIAAKKLSPVELTNHLLARIKTVDPIINAFLLVTEERAMADEPSPSGSGQSGELQIVVCELADEHYGLDIAGVFEIIRHQPITPVPRAPSFVKGVINLRGRIIPVVDLRARFASGVRSSRSESGVVSRAPGSAGGSGPRIG